MKWLQDFLLFELHSCSSGKAQTVRKLDTSTRSTNTGNNHLLVRTRTVRMTFSLRFRLGVFRLRIRNMHEDMV